MKKELDLIDRNDLINSIDHFIHPDGEIHKDSLMAMINVLPQYQHNRYSEWVQKDGINGFFCKECDGFMNAKTNYCPFCGARVVEECD